MLPHFAECLSLLAATELEFDGLNIGADFFNGGNDFFF